MRRTLCLLTWAAVRWRFWPKKPCHCKWCHCNAQAMLRPPNRPTALVIPRLPTALPASRQPPSLAHPASMRPKPPPLNQMIARLTNPPATTHRSKPWRPKSSFPVAAQPAAYQQTHCPGRKTGPKASTNNTPAGRPLVASRSDTATTPPRQQTNPPANPQHPRPTPANLPRTNRWQTGQPTCHWRRAVAANRHPRRSR